MNAKQKSLIKKLKKDKIPALAVGLISNRKGSPKFFEVILERKFRYSTLNVFKKIPKSYLGIKVKVI